MPTDSRRKAMKKTVSRIALTMLLTAMLMLAFDVQLTKSEPMAIVVPNVTDKNNTYRNSLTNPWTLVPPKKFVGVCYGPFRDNEAPGFYPTLEEMREDVYFLKNLASSIRTYSMSGNLSEIPRICEDVCLDCYPGAWISKQKKDNEIEIQRLIEAARNVSCVKGLIVGNEVLLRGDVTEDDLIEYIRMVKNSTNLPVTTGEIWSVWENHPKLVENVDFLLVHIHPYWEGISCDNATGYVVEKWEDLKRRFPEKEIVIGETGWPTSGDMLGGAVPSEENQKTFLEDFKKSAEEKGIRYFYFEAFDEKWKGILEGAGSSEENQKIEDGVGEHWGIYYSNGSLKPLLKDFVPEEVREGFERKPRDRRLSLPCFVYKDAFSPENRFIPSGWMGDLENWPGDPQEVFDEACSDNPYSGDTCIRINYTPRIVGWSGIYWQFPERNWGKLPGYDLSVASKIVFWARGKEGGELARFKAGGIQNPEEEFQDSFYTSTSVINLTKQWKKYTIDLAEANLSTVIGGFCWVTNKTQNPEGCVIYLDNIYYVSQDFSISASPTSLTIQQGSWDSSTITVTSIEDFSQPVQLTVSGVPSDVTATLSPEQVAPPADGSTISILTVSIDATAIPENYTLTVIGTSGTMTHSLNVSLEIEAVLIRFTFNAEWEGIIYPVVILSNSTIPEFFFNQSLARISLEVSGETGMVGCCNVTIPKTLLKGEPWTVRIDEGVWSFTRLDNATHSSLYFTYTHASTLQVTIQGTWVIPEFSSVIILPLFIAVALLAVAITKRRLSGRPNPKKPSSPCLFRSIDSVKPSQ